MCGSCGTTWRVGSTKPEVHVDVCSNCHPFFTGTQRIVDTTGQVERFTKRLQAREAIAPQVEGRPSKKERRRQQRAIRSGQLEPEPEVVTETPVVTEAPEETPTPAEAVTPAEPPAATPTTRPPRARRPHPPRKPRREGPRKDVGGAGHRSAPDASSRESAAHQRDDAST